MATSMLDIDADLAQRTPLVSASFRLTSDRHLLDHFIGDFAIEGAQSWQKGDVEEGQAQTRRAYGWSVTLPAQRSYSVDTAISELLLRLAPQRDAIIDAIRALELDAHVCLDVHVAPGHLPVLHAAPATIAAMASYNAACSVELREF